MGEEKKILVIGSINMDLIYRLPRVPGPGENLFATDYTEGPGGKGSNQAIAVSRLGGDVSYIGKIGHDAHGKSLRHSLEKFRVPTDNLLVTDDAATGRALILLEENGQNRIIILNGANGLLSPDDIKQHLDQHLDSYDVILLQLEIPLDTVSFTIDYACELGIPVIVDAGPPLEGDIHIFDNVEIISPNQSEIYSLTGHKAGNQEEARSACRILRELTRANMVILKMGGEGALLYDDQGFNFFPSYQVEVKDTTAAGDAFSAALAVGYARDWSIDKVISFANAAGALAVSRLGAHSSMPESSEVKEFMEKNGIELW